MAVIQVQVVSDILCAWCYIAKRNLERAISLYQRTYPGGKADTFVITWTPYYLEYNKTPHSVDKRALADESLAHMTHDQRDALTRKMERAGRGAGIEFKWGGMIGPSTRDAHRLIRWTGREEGPEVQAEFVEGLFDAYQAREMDVSEREVLRDVAARAGIDGGEVDAYLASDEDVEAVDEEARRAKEEFGGSGVPAFVVQNVHRLDGVQDAMDLYEVFVKVREEQDKESSG